MRESLIGTTTDLLAFHQSGNFSKFDRCFSKACQYIGLDLDDRARSRLRNMAFHYLRSTGYLDVSFSGSSSLWSMSPNAVIGLPGEGYVPIGDSKFQSTFAEAFPPQAVRERREGESPIACEFYPVLPLVLATPVEAQVASAKLNVPLVENYQKSIFERLPSVHAMASECLKKTSNDIMLSVDETSRMEFSEGKWLEYHDTRIREPGLYRREYRYSPADYFIASAPRKGMLETHQVMEREWYAVAALWKLKLPVSVLYDEKLRHLAFPRRSDAFRIPTLLERALRSGSLLNPIITAERRIYQGISPSCAWMLASKFPVFKVEKI